MNTFDALLRSIGELPSIVGDLTTYKPRSGRRHNRVYRSLGDAAAYEAGYSAGRQGGHCKAAAGTPFAVGWADAERDRLDGPETVEA